MINEGDIVLCTVKSIVGTSVFVHIEGDGEGTIVTSEIAPGRIRNIRDYVVPGKKIACKVLRIDDRNNIYLSLRRVTSKERNEIAEKFEKEKEYQSIIKAVVKEKSVIIIEDIKRIMPLYDFIEGCKEDNKKLEKYFSSQEAQQICKILNERKNKQVEVKKEFLLSSFSPDGITIIKKIFSPYNNITYLAAGRFVLKVTAGDYKKANQEMLKIITEIEAKAKKEKAEFSVKEK